HAVPLGDLLPLRGAEAPGARLEEGDRRLRPLQAADRHRDRPGLAVLPRRGVPPGLLQEESDPLQVLQVRLRPREAARAVVGQIRTAMRERQITRRRALQSVGSMVADAVAGAQAPRAEGAVRLSPREQLVNVLEYEDQARRVLGAAAYAAIAGGDRSGFERITLRPRMMVPVLDLNLGVTLFGEAMFAPILVAPIARQGDFHADGERATVAGASAAKAVTVVSSHSSVPLASLAAAGNVPLWYQVFAQDPSAPARIQEAVTAGCRAICITIGAPPAARSA